ncbi:hypothetical protein CKN63_13260 [Carnobacterium divergens]|uniref:hypothetical protein n=1 Tax=Carnobacterium divergens TaxID=2748 RepID=UPI001071F19D|nr:hypothetical protein [Carnobacterium divergens]TFI60529.1 hypothetical protein CKN59_13195 [Carnobacterium divergens]TFI61671.1 hypothetical protein CKN76_12790 [Carnobacterium divergens]TFJ01004.1 hypothetical protein CKN75_12785 [Carnobacterium divergens]TFJ08924.1 hypothetical protein CKN71_12800 [Carnobacterium divergens]TFJ15633.1 hypothetical protein CKN63_13260 [Carnobacterium divergens]
MAIKKENIRLQVTITPETQNYLTYICEKNKIKERAALEQLIKIHYELEQAWNTPQLKYI